MIAVIILGLAAIISAPVIVAWHSRRKRQPYITLRPRIGLERKER